MYPSSFEPMEKSDIDHPEPMEERRAESSWRTWLLVMLAIVAVVVVFMLMGDPEAATETSQVLTETPTN